MTEQERNPERGPQDDEHEDEMGNRKTGGGVPTLFAVLGTAILTAIGSGIADRYFARGETDGREFAVAIGELRTTVGALSAQVQRLADQPYASRDEMRELRADVAGLERRIARIEGRLFPESRGADR